MVTVAVMDPHVTHRQRAPSRFGPKRYVKASAMTARTASTGQRR